MPRKVTLITLVALTISLLSASAPSARAGMTHYAFCPFAWTVCPSSVAFDVDGQLRPDTLPRWEMAPVGLLVRGRIAAGDGGHPPALREVVVDFDRNVEIDASRYSSCGLRRLERRRRDTVRASCRNAIVGAGQARVQIGPPGQRPIPASVSLTLINGGVAGGATKLFVHGEVPGYGPVVSRATMRRVRKGRYGSTATWRVPQIMGGVGSLLDFSFRLKRGYANARCTDGKLLANIIKALFRDEGEGPKTSTILKGVVIRPCVPKS